MDAETECKVTVVRPEAGYADSLRAYRILIDGREVGRIKRGEMLSFTVPTGGHILEAKIDWCGAPRLEFTASPDTERVAEVSNSGVWPTKSALFNTLYLALYPRRYLSLMFVDKPHR